MPRRTTNKTNQNKTGKKRKHADTSKPPSPSTHSDEEEQTTKKPKITYDEETQDLQALMAKMGLPTSFGSTKGKQVEKNEEGDVFIKPKRSYQQFMNLRVVNQDE